MGGSRQRQRGAPAGVDFSPDGSRVVYTRAPTVARPDNCVVVPDALLLSCPDDAGVELAEAIRERRAVRTFTREPVDDTDLQALIDAAIQAPSARNAQPWGFVVVQEKALLEDYAQRAAAHYLTLDLPDPYGSEIRATLSQPGYDIFHSAPALIAIYAREGRHDNVADCFLAAQNLMLAAHDAGLGTCPIGLARPYLDLPEVKEALSVSPEWSVALPLIVGHPAAATEPPGRRPAVVLAWRRA